MNPYLYQTNTFIPPSVPINHIGSTYLGIKEGPVLFYTILGGIGLAAAAGAGTLAYYASGKKSNWAIGAGVLVGIGLPVGLVLAALSSFS